jgi:hypothetical protein
VLGTLFGLIPITVTNVYIGSLAADLATLGYFLSNQKDE